MLVDFAGTYLARSYLSSILDYAVSWSHLLFIYHLIIIEKSCESAAIFNMHFRYSAIFFVHML